MKIDETSTASDIARRVACQLDLNIKNPSLVEEIPNSATILDPQGIVQILGQSISGIGAVISSKMRLY